ncbi:TRAP transporter permease [Paracoccus seriniphilus]|uniref:TRAP transporter, 4TM/12TM fusion protein n=1 Tax=Paracoccus seriniphilus TaxID=184748 RepID=A0A239PR33_9RHOB|nr:TRAP transporter permease [Paracoccus seriniphilus]WCR12844.1 TRAP transporter permease [Paracoccus seriniphilus]SNT72735.1 TRAP transporter, 4TM/12TM fusion protein [Paracoccus seriniphilus]
MTQAQHPAPADNPDLGLHDPLADSFPTGVEGKLLYWIAVAFSLYQIAIAAHIVNLTSQIQRALHLGFLVLLCFPLLAALRGKGRGAKMLAWGLGLLGVIVAGYQWAEYVPLMMRSGALNQIDVVIGVIALVTTFAAAYVIMGPALPMVAGIFLIYALFGQHFPGPLVTRGYDFAQVVEQMSYGTEGIYGTPLYVSATYIFLFILFGSFLEKAGMIKLFTDVSLGMVGHKMGGAAKVSVVSSGLMGTISGSGVANVVTTGQFTIPLMKSFGYRPAFAGGVEATASMGGQIMPPVMGAVAFIMAETLGVAYFDVVRAAIIPALLYFASAFWMVHLEAGRRNLRGMSRDELPSARRALREGWYLILPLAVLVYLLFSGYTPLFAGTIGLALTIMLILGASAALGLPQGTLRVIFWIGLGLLAASFLEFGNNALWLGIAILLLWNALRTGGRETIRQVIDSLAEGAKTALPVGVACALVGVIIATMTLTGAANTFGLYIVSVGKDSLILSLILTMITCIVLGMGIPTIPNYIITSTIAAPALLQLGVPLIVSHMFVFYFGILADLTPPVALACFAAAPIAKENGLRISFEALKVAAAGFVIPYMAVYTPALMLQDGGPLAQSIGYAPAVAYIVLKCLLAIGLWGMTVTGWFIRPLASWERVLTAAAAFLLIAALPLSDEVGFALTALCAGIWWLRRTA